MLHAVKYKAMQGFYAVVEKTELSYSGEEAENLLTKIKDYYKDDMLEYTFYGPDGIIEDYIKQGYAVIRDLRNED
jgi:hypothetical protein